MSRERRGSGAEANAQRTRQDGFCRNKGRYDMKSKWHQQSRRVCNSRRGGKAKGGAYITDIFDRSAGAARGRTTLSHRYPLIGR